MSETECLLPEHTEVDAALRALGIAVDASELHGALAGFVCGGGSPQSGGWLQQLELEGRDAERAAPVRALFDATCAQLADSSFGFELLLPAEEIELDRRADAVVGWARGFLGGFGLAAGPQPKLSEESAEALDDLGNIAASALSCDDPDNDEASLTEVCEFVRMAALLLLHDGRAPAPPSASIH